MLRSRYIDNLDDAMIIGKNFNNRHAREMKARRDTEIVLDLAPEQNSALKGSTLRGAAALSRARKIADEVVDLAHPKVEAVELPQAVSGGIPSHFADKLRVALTKERLD